MNPIYSLLCAFLVAFVGLCHVVRRRERQIANRHAAETAAEMAALKAVCDTLRMERDFARGVNQSALAAIHQAYEANSHLVMVVEHQRVQLVKLQHGRKDVPLTVN